MGKGWHGDSYKHKLASKGVKSKKEAYTHGAEYVPETPSERRKRRIQTIKDISEYNRQDPDSLFFDPSTLEAEGLLNGIAEEKGITEDDVDQKELRIGIEEEFEHTNNFEIAKKIALDHLAEHPNYYTKLKEAGL